MIRPDLSYIQSIRHELHQYPELGFELPRTLSVVRRELDSMGIAYTERYGKSSVVATLAPGRGTRRIALRADMDALPVEEQTGLPYASRIPGQMHACGHDCHTAMLLGTAKALKQMEEELPCTVKLVFQPAEEISPSGARLMCEDGVQEEYDEILCAHVSTAPSGTVSLNRSVMSASCQSFRITVHGKSAHVANPHEAVDAIAIAAQIYTGIQLIRARQFPPREPLIIGIGTIHGGSASNVICDCVTMDGTIRAHSMDTALAARRKVDSFAAAMAAELGGSAELVWNELNPPVINDEQIADRIIGIAGELLGPENVREHRGGMGGEDFAYLVNGRPGLKIQIGAQKPGTPKFVGHGTTFNPDEDVLDIAPRIFLEYITRFGG